MTVLRRPKEILGVDNALVLRLILRLVLKLVLRLDTGPETGYWSLDTGAWVLKPGAWVLKPGVWVLKPAARSSCSCNEEPCTVSSLLRAGRGYCSVRQLVTVPKLIELWTFW